MRRSGVRRESLPSFANGGEAKFEVTATFGEGAVVALVDPETSAVRQLLYDAESTSGRLSFSDGEETTIVWTRMSGADGALIGEAIMSDGDVLALTIDHGDPRNDSSARSFCSPQPQQACSAEPAPLATPR